MGSFNFQHFENYIIYEYNAEVNALKGACLDCMLPGVQVTAGLGFFLRSSHLCDSEDCDSLH